MSSDIIRNPEKKLIVLGTIFMDIKGYAQAPFFPTGRNKGTISYCFGGVARNVAADAAALGLHPVFISQVSRDGREDAILKDLEQKGVDITHILKHEEGAGTWMVILDPEGDVCANLSRRQNLLPLCGLLDEEGPEIFAGADGILVEMDIEEEVLSRVFQLAERFGIAVYGVISNMTIAMTRLSYIRKTRCFICNRFEAGQLFETELEHVSSQELQSILCEYMKKLRIRCMVVTMDRDGAVFADFGTDSDIPVQGYCPAERVTMVDSTGAGDAFFAGVSAGMICGGSLKEACRLGTKMAAGVVASSENVYCTEVRSDA